MKKLLFICIYSLLCCYGFTQDKEDDKTIKSKQFFSDESTLNATITTDLNYLLGKGMNREFIKANFNCKLPDSTDVNEQIRLQTRGHFRHSYCYIPPLKLNFKNPTSPKLSGLGSLKLTVGCKLSTYFDQLVLKEYLVYRMYNIITDMSLRARLVKLTLEDEKHKKKPITQFAFFTEDPGAMAKRNKCREVKEPKFPTETTNRMHMTLVSMFEYMIGNTDWAVSVYHNILLIRSKEDSTSRPFAVGYDFDYSGVVNAEYAVPDPQLGTETVLERVYRGFPRTELELAEVTKIFAEKKQAIYDLIKNCEPLSSANKKEMTGYLDDFFKLIKEPRLVRETFIDNARMH